MLIDLLELRKTRQKFQLTFWCCVHSFLWISTQNTTALVLPSHTSQGMRGGLGGDLYSIGSPNLGTGRVVGSVVSWNSLLQIP